MNDIKLKSCNDDDCDMKTRCLRWRGNGVLQKIRHKIDKDGLHYCNEFMTLLKYAALLKQRTL